MRAPAILAICLLPISAMAQSEDRSWHLLQRQQNGGIAAVIHGLTKAECEFAKNRIEGRPATEEEKAVVTAAREKRAAEWKKWMDDHGCKQNPNQFGATSGPSEKLADGSCVQGSEFNAVTFGYSSATDVRSAECFQ